MFTEMGGWPTLRYHCQSVVASPESCHMNEVTSPVSSGDSSRKKGVKYSIINP